MPKQALQAFAHIMRRGQPARLLLVATFLGVFAPHVAAERRVFELTIHDGEVSPKSAVFSVVQNDEVVVQIASDQPMHIHLHGYDVESDIPPNGVTRLRFRATATGRFPVEAHNEQKRRRRPLAYIEVRPR